MTRTETKIDVREGLGVEELGMAQLLTDEYNLKILSGTTSKGMSVRDMAFAYFIPLATCYRKVAELEGAGLLRMEGKLLSRDGKKYSVYRSCIKGFEVSYKDGNLIFNVQLSGKGPKQITIDLTDGKVIEVS